MRTTSRAPRQNRCLTLAGRALLSLLVTGSGAARAQEASDVGASGDSHPSPVLAAASQQGLAMGLEAFALMQRLRREQRGVPKMLPLLATRTEHGQLWLGLTRGRSAADGAARLRLEIVWQIPTGQ